MEKLNREKLLEDIDFAVKATGNSDEYFQGMCNGMICIKSWITGEEPIYQDSPIHEDCGSFGNAIKVAKNGYRIARNGWNGKGMFVVYQKGYPDGIHCNKNTADAFGYKEGDLFKCRPYLQMRCADGTHQMWNASQSDILANDWIIVE